MTPDSSAAEQATGGFVAGTLVHTKEGLVPIEKIRIGSWVLSHPEGSDRVTTSRKPEHESSCRKVTKTFVHDNQPIMHVTYSQPGAEA